MGKTIRLDRLLFWNYELKKENGEWKKYIFRDEIKNEHNLSIGTIRNLCNDYQIDGKTNPRRYKGSNFTIRRIHEQRGTMVSKEASKTFIPNEETKELEKELEKINS